MAAARIGGNLSSLIRAPADCAACAARSQAARMSGLASFQRFVRVSASVGAPPSRVSTRRSRPVMAAAANARSPTLAANRPAVSSDQEKHFIPTVGRRRNDGLKPATPQKAAGRMIEPPVWLPSAIGTMPAATAAAEPADEPPGVYARLCGLRAALGSRLASSLVTVFPKRRPPARRASATNAASAL